MRLRIFTITLSILYCFCLAAIGLADFCFMRSREITGEPLKYINTAKILNPLNSEYYYRKFEILISGNRKMDKSTQIRNERISLLRKAIELEPTNPKYHMFYGLELVRDYSLRTRLTDRLALLELKRAIALKPFSRLYLKILNDYSPSLQSNP